MTLHFSSETFTLFNKQIFLFLSLVLQSSLEHDVYSRLSTLQEGLIPKKRAGADDDLHRINELIQVRLLLHIKNKGFTAQVMQILKNQYFLSYTCGVGRS